MTIAEESKNFLCNWEFNAFNGIAKLQLNKSSNPRIFLKYFQRQKLF